LELEVVVVTHIIPIIWATGLLMEMEAPAGHTHVLMQTLHKSVTRATAPPSLIITLATEVDIRVLEEDFSLLAVAKLLDKGLGRVPWAPQQVETEDLAAVAVAIAPGQVLVAVGRGEMVQITRALVEVFLAEVEALPKTAQICLHPGQQTLHEMLMDSSRLQGYKEKINGY
jgi:hypothetical protein